MSSELILKDSFYKERILNRSFHSMSASHVEEPGQNFEDSFTDEQLRSSLHSFGRTPAHNYAYLALNCSNKAVSSLQKVGQFLELQRVDVSHNYIKTLRPLSKLRYLTYLDASHNGLSRLLDFKQIPLSLDYVDCSYNEIEKIPDLSCHRFLRVLRLKSNRIRQIAGLARNQNLKELDLSENQIEDIENLEDLRLLHLDLSVNRIHLLKGLDRLPALQVLKCTRNSIQRLAGISQVFSLRELYLAGNKIRQVKEIENLVRLACLTVLDLCFCPIQEQRYYRFQVLYRLPILRLLDGVQVCSEEIVKASNLYGEEVSEQARIFKELLPEEEFIDRRVHFAEFIEEQSDSSAEDIFKENSKLASIRSKDRLKNSTSKALSLQARK